MKGEFEMFCVHTLKKYCINIRERESFVIHGHQQLSLTVSNDIYYARASRRFFVKARMKIYERESARR